MINPSRVLLNPRFRQTWHVYRSEGHFGPGGWIEDIPSPPYFDMSGVAWPSTAKEIEQVPEADRVTGMHTFCSKETLYVTRANDTGDGISDKIEWKGELYKLIQILDFSDYGFNAAVGVRLKGC